MIQETAVALIEVCKNGISEEKIGSIHKHRSCKQICLATRFGPTPLFRNVVIIVGTVKR